MEKILETFKFNDNYEPLIDNNGDKWYVDEFEEEKQTLEYIKQAKKNGFTVEDIKLKNDPVYGEEYFAINLHLLFKGGYSVKEIHSAYKNSKNKNYITENSGLPVKELKALGYTANQLKNYPVVELKEVGFTIKELKFADFKLLRLLIAGFTVGELVFSGCYSRSDFLEIGYTYNDFVFALNNYYNNKRT